MEVRKELYIGGRWTAPSRAAISRSSTAAPKSRWAACPEAPPLRSKKQSPPPGRRFRLGPRARLPTGWRRCERIADGLAAREEQLADLMSREVGTPIATSRRVQVGLSVDVFRSIADILEEFPLEERIGTSLLIRQPAGVVAAITPWNYPLYQLAAKLAPALAAGCTTILKPAGAAPLAAFELAEIIDELGLAARHRQRRQWARTGDRRPARRASPGRHGQHHWVDPGRDQRRREGRSHGQAGHAGTRRQVRVRVVGRQRPRRRPAGCRAQLASSTTANLVRR